MNKKTRSKLVLNKETLRTLPSSELRKIAAAKAGSNADLHCYSSNLCTVTLLGCDPNSVFCE